MVHSPDGLIDWVFPRGMTVEKLINDGLMVIFFFVNKIIFPESEK